MTTSEAEALEAEVRRLMAYRARLACIPGTHRQRAEKVDEIDQALDLWHIAAQLDPADFADEAASS